MTTLREGPLYLSRLYLNPRSRQVMSELAYPYEMHRTLMHAFMRATDDTKMKSRDEFGVLFRAEVDDEQGTVQVYVQSRVKPNWSYLNGMNDYLSGDLAKPACAFRPIMQEYGNIQNGQVLLFRLRANPTKRVAKHDDKMKGKRVELRREDEQIDWLLGRRKEKGFVVRRGFDLVTKQDRDLNGNVRLVQSVRVCPEGKQKGRKRTLERGRFMTHSSVLFDGLLQVTDTKAFMDTIVHGIGPGKAFGFGLLSVAPVRASS